MTTLRSNSGCPTSRGPTVLFGPGTRKAIFFATLYNPSEQRTVSSVTFTEGILVHNEITPYTTRDTVPSSGSRRGRSPRTTAPRRGSSARSRTPPSSSREVPRGPGREPEYPEHLAPACTWSRQRRRRSQVSPQGWRCFGNGVGHYACAGSVNPSQGGRRGAVVGPRHTKWSRPRTALATQPRMYQGKIAKG